MTDKQMNVVTFYDVRNVRPEPLAVFRLTNGTVQIESMVGSSEFVYEWLEGTWDPDEERMIRPAEGERFLRALVDRPMTYFRFEPGEANARNP
jgi:hypothetical protein